MQAFLHRWLLILLLLPALGLADDTRIQVIDLQGRSAQEMIPLIQPLLDEGDAITGTGYQLILRTRPENLARIEAVVKRLDQAPKRLRITVHRGELDTREQYRHDIRLERKSDGVRLEAGEASNGGGLAVYVLARLRGDGQVQLDISPHKEALSPRGGGMVETSALITSVSGPVDTWLELGGIGETRNQDTQEYTRSRRTRDRQEEQLWFRVEVLD
ncbi:MAG: hypothetical protein LC646_10295 [Xanthomonadaceae bacterium]|nr:hypothetical protein [Xanthomonadaceae bacterium]